MYAVHPSIFHPEESNWQDYHRYTSSQLPNAVRQWILDSTSLTQRLLKVSGGHFKVRVLSQSWQRPRRSERSLLDMSDREIAIVREVVLLCHNQAWVFARSIIPASSVSGHLRQLRKFKDSSLGAMLFSDPSMRRMPFQLTRLNGQSKQIPRQLRQPEQLWGRRSRFELAGKPIMVSEIFLPAFRPD